MALGKGGKTLWGEKKERKDRAMRKKRQGPLFRKKILN